MRLFIYEDFVLNVNNDEIADQMLEDANTKRELTSEEITAIFKGLPHLAGPTTTSVDEDGNITFTPPEHYTDFSCWIDTVVRPERDMKLSQSDKYMIPDYPINQATRDQWAAYRQVLRELPKVLTKITTPIPWPVEPA